MIVSPVALDHISITCNIGAEYKRRGYMKWLNPWEIHVGLYIPLRQSQKFTWFLSGGFGIGLSITRQHKLRIVQQWSNQLQLYKQVFIFQCFEKERSLECSFWSNKSYLRNFFSPSCLNWRSSLVVCFMLVTTLRRPDCSVNWFTCIVTIVLHCIKEFIQFTHTIESGFRMFNQSSEIINGLLF